MADDFLYCPSCNNKLRITAEMLGAVVQCPICSIIFTTPTRGGAGPANLVDEGEREKARQALRRPALGLLITGILGTLVHLVMVGMALLAPKLVLKLHDDVYALQSQAFDLGASPFGPEAKILAEIVQGGLFATLNLVLIVAALKMLRLRSFGLALAGTLLALLDCGNFCCLLSWPFGIWALAVLLRPEVKRAFE